MKTKKILDKKTLQNLIETIDLLIEILDYNHQKHSSIKNFDYLITIKQIKSNLKEILSDYLKVNHGTRKY